METTLIFAQTVFYFTVSVGVVLIAFLCVIATYHLVRIAHEIEDLPHDFGHTETNEERGDGLRRKK